jgi:histidinol-phosphatase
MHSVADLQLAFDTSDLAAELAPAHFESGVSANAEGDGTPSPKPTGQSSACFGRRCRRPGPKMPSSARNLVNSASPIGWILDPIDGTGFFNRGDPNWRMHIALEV